MSGMTSVSWVDDDPRVTPAVVLGVNTDAVPLLYAALGRYMTRSPASPPAEAAP